MERQIEQAMLRAIETMRRNVGEPISVDDLARAAVFSKFHFSRVFHRVTGLSPGHFLTAIRIEEAKRLLVTTALPVTEISHLVGYSSVGSFTTRFSLSVGVSPSSYRQLMATERPLPPRPREPAERRSATVRGRVWSTLPDSCVFVGLFPDRILQGKPVTSTILTRPGPFLLENVPPGAWHLLACSTSPGPDAAAEPVHVGRYGPIVIRLGTGARLANVRLRPPGPLDPPVLLAVAGLHHHTSRTTSRTTGRPVPMATA